MCAALSAAALLAAAAGADGDGGVLTLSLAEARARALAVHPAVHGAAQAWTAARARSAEAWAVRRPQVEVSGQYARLSDIPAPAVAVPTPAGEQVVPIAPVILDSYGLTASVTVPLFTGHRLENAARAAGEAVSAAAHEVTAARQELSLAVARAYWQTCGARAAARAVAESVGLMGAYLRDVENQRAAGLADDDDVLAVAVRLGEARLRLLQAEHGARVAQASLSSLLSLPLETEIALADSARVADREPAPLDSLLRLARQRRPELAAAEGRRRAAGYQTAVAAGARLPSLSLRGDYALARPNLRYFPPADDWHGTWQVGVGVQWTAWDWRATAWRVQRAEAEQRAVAARQRLEADRIDLEVMAARLAVVEAESRADLAAAVLRRAAEHERHLRERFRAGTATTAQVLDAEVALEGARRDGERAAADWMLAWSQLERAAGEPVP